MGARSPIDKVIWCNNVLLQTGWTECAIAPGCLYHFEETLAMFITEVVDQYLVIQ